MFASPYQYVAANGMHVQANACVDHGLTKYPFVRETSLTLMRTLMHCCAACSSHTRHLHLHFLRSPTQIIDSGNGSVAGLQVEVNTLESSPDNTNQKAVGTNKHESLDAQLVLESIGYKSYPLSGAPFDDRRGIIPNT